MQYIPRPYLFIPTASLPPIQKPYSLHQSPLVGGQNGIQVLGLWTFVLEEFGDNVPDYINSLDSTEYCSSQVRSMYSGHFFLEKKVYPDDKVIHLHDFWKQ